jgi:hypothetical protein
MANILWGVWTFEAVKQTQSVKQTSTTPVVSSISWITKIDATQPSQKTIPDSTKFMSKDRVNEIIMQAKQNWDDPKAVLKEAVSKGYTLEWFDQFQKEAVKQQLETQPETQPEKWYFGKLGDILRERSWKIGEAFGRDQTRLETAWQVAWNVIWGATDAVLQTAWSVIQTVTPDVIENAVKEWAKWAFNAFASTDIGAWAIDALKWWVESYNSRAQENPRASANLGAMVDIASVIHVGKWIQLAKQW